MTNQSIFKSKDKIHRIALRWGGIAGDGLQSTGVLFSKYLNQLGYFSYSFPGTQSTIRGGHVWMQTEFASSSFASFDRSIDFLIALNDQTLDVHLPDVKSHGIVLVDNGKVNIKLHQEKLLNKKIIVFKSPLTELAREVDKKTVILKNTVAMGIILSILQLDIEIYKTILDKRFKNRPEILNMNLNALEKGVLTFKNELVKNLDKKTPISLAPGSFEPGKYIIITGNQMIALGAMASGLKFLAQYPITPASSILTYLSQRAQKFGIIVRQVEDEIAAINSIIGASWAGVRVMTATSGPGLSLMAEALGYAGMTETPIVIVVSMRGGPSTGIPTKISQEDLLPVLNLSHGEFPRAIIAPRNMQECFDATVRAFNIADKYQLPVLLLVDFAISERFESIKPFSLEVDINRGKIWTEPTEEFPEFKRFEITEDGISPRTIPGTKNAIHVLVGAEHDEYSNSLSGNRCGLPLSGELRIAMIHKRFRKLSNLAKEMNGPTWFGSGSDKADYTVICWGSLEGAVKESIYYLNENSDQQQWNMLSFSDMFPLPVNKIIPELNKIKIGIMIECNVTRQFEQLLFLHTNWKPMASINPLSGETPTPHSIIPELINAIKNLETKTYSKQDLKAEVYF